ISQCIAESLANLESDPHRHAAYKIVLANRHMNLGVLYKELEPPTTQSRATAEEHFKKSFDWHLKTDNIEGIAQVSGNLGQLYLDTDRTTEAATLLTDAYEIRFCLKEVIRLCESPAVNRPSLAASIREVAESVAGDLSTTSGSTAKDVALVLDCSGSMTGAFIRACRQSLIDIITQYTFPDDQLSLTTFRRTHQEVWPLMSRDEEFMINLVQMNTETDGNTAFCE
ncbi:hypothetical protein BC938DRAFT_471163, partial [Jimgerdemannia flammicorona]